MIYVHNLNIQLGKFRIKKVDFRVKKGDFIVILGPTAAGKSIIIESIAGLVPIQSGKIIVSQKDVTNLKPEKRNISICYQDYNLFPHMNVKDNIVYGLRFKKDRNNPKYRKNFDTLINLLKLENILNRLPTYLSGGEQQRVSLARALVVEPDILLLDEPLSALDPNTKENIQEELKNIHQTMQTTIIMVTHDFTEANYLADKVILVNKGRVIQQGSIEDIFQRPESIFAAQFTGIKNIFWLEKKEDLEEFHLEKPTYIGIRPENIHLNHYSISSFYHFQGEIKRIKNNGVYMEIELKDNKRSYISYLTLNRFFEMSISQGKIINFGFEKEHLITINKPK